MNKSVNVINSEIDTSMVDALSAAEEPLKCKIIDRKIIPCETLSDVLENEDALRVSQSEGKSEYICFDYTGYVLEVCPFCRATICRDEDI